MVISAHPRTSYHLQRIDLPRRALSSRLLIPVLAALAGAGRGVLPDDEIRAAVADRNISFSI